MNTNDTNKNLETGKNSENIEQKKAKELVEDTRRFINADLKMNENDLVEINKYLDSLDLPKDTEGWNKLIEKAGFGDKAVITEANKKAEAFSVWENDNQGSELDNYFLGLKNLLDRSKKDLWSKFKVELDSFVPKKEEELKNETEEQRKERAVKVLQFLKKIFDDSEKQNNEETKVTKNEGTGETKIENNEKTNEMNEDQINTMIPLLCDKLLEKGKEIRRIKGDIKSYEEDLESIENVDVKKEIEQRIKDLQDEKTRLENERKGLIDQINGLEKAKIDHEKVENLNKEINELEEEINNIKETLPLITNQEAKAVLENNLKNLISKKEKLINQKKEILGIKQDEKKERGEVKSEEIKEEKKEEAKKEKTYEEIRSLKEVINNLKLQIEFLKKELADLIKERDEKYNSLANSDRGSKNYDEVARYNKEIEKIKALTTKTESELQDKTFDFRNFIANHPELGAKYKLLEEIMDRINELIKRKNRRVNERGGEDTFKRDVEVSEFYDLMKNEEFLNLLQEIKEHKTGSSEEKENFLNRIKEFSKKISERINVLENEKNDGVVRGHRNYQESFGYNREIEDLSSLDFDKNLDLFLEELLKAELPESKKQEIESFKEEVKKIKAIIDQYKEKITDELKNKNPNFIEINDDYQVIQILRGYLFGKLRDFFQRSEVMGAEGTNETEERRDGSNVGNEGEVNPREPEKPVSPITPDSPTFKVDKIELKSTSVDVSGIINKFAERIAEKRYNTEVQNMNIFKRGWNRWRTKNEKINKYKEELERELTDFYRSGGTSALSAEYQGFSQDVNDCKNQCEAFAIRVARHENNGIDREISDPTLKANVEDYLLGTSTITEGALRAQYQAYVQNNKSEADFDTRKSSEDFIHNLRREKANYDLNLQLIDLAGSGNLDTATVETLVQNFRLVWIEDPRLNIHADYFEGLNDSGKKKLASHLKSVLSQEIENMKLYFKVFNKGGENSYTDEGAFNIDKEKEDVIDNAGFFKKAMRKIGKFAEKHPIMSAVLVGGLGVGSAVATGGLSGALLAGSAVSAGVASSAKKLAQREKGFDNYENQRTQGLSSATERLQMLENDPTYGPDSKVKKWLLKRTLKKEAKFYDPFFEEIHLESARNYSQQIMNLAQKSDLSDDEKNNLKELLKEASARLNYRDESGHNILRGESPQTIEDDLSRLERSVKFAKEKFFGTENIEYSSYLEQGKEEKAVFDKKVTMEAWRDFLLKAGMVAAAGTTAQYLRGTGMFRKTVEKTVQTAAQQTGVDIFNYIENKGTPAMKQALKSQNFEEVLRLLKEAEKNKVIGNLNANIERSLNLLPEVEKLLQDNHFDPEKLESLLKMDFNDGFERNKYLWNYIAEAYGGDPANYPIPLEGTKITPFPGLSGAKHAELTQLIQDLQSDYINNMISQIDPSATDLNGLADNISVDQLKNALSYLSSDRIGIPGARQVLAMVNNGASTTEVLQYLQTTNDNQLTSNLLNALNFGQRGAIIDQPTALLEQVANMNGTLDVLAQWGSKTVPYDPNWQDYAMSLVGALYAPGAAYNSELPKKEDPSKKVQEPKGEDLSNKVQETNDKVNVSKEQVQALPPALEQKLQWFNKEIQDEKAKVNYNGIPKDYNELSEEQVQWIKEVYPKISNLKEELSKFEKYNEYTKEYKGHSIDVSIAEKNFREILEKLDK